MLSLDVLLYTLILLPSTVQPHRENSRNVFTDVSVLSEIVESFQVQDSTMEEALRTLRQYDFARILIGFEKIVHREGEKTESLSLPQTALLSVRFSNSCANSPSNTNTRSSKAASFMCIRHTRTATRLAFSTSKSPTSRSKGRWRLPQSSCELGSLPLD